MDAILDSGSGKPSEPYSSRARADDTGIKDDDCIILEVYDPLSISYAFPANPVLADPESQVLENAAPLVTEKPITAKASRAKRAQDSDSGAPATSKRHKTQSLGPAGARKRSKGILTSTG
jgi:hypothetical protein